MRKGSQYKYNSIKNAKIKVTLSENEGIKYLVHEYDFTEKVDSNSGHPLE